MMKVCRTCGREIESACASCDYVRAVRAERKRQRQRRERNRRARINRKVRESALRDCGLVKVRGALGGTYWIERNACGKVE